LTDEQSKKETANGSDEEFSLDKNFGILAEEIKKRMKLKKEIKDTKSYQVSKKNDVTMNAKKELLPLLKNIEALTGQRDNYSEKIKQVDEELEKVKNNILSIKVSYEKDISDLKNNINFFDQSIALINNIKGEE
jgi:peptidoglycan hydrolase CwlO-like protein